jgi:AcrR family transcriptional regulator
MAEPLDTRSQLIDATVKELVETGPGSLRVSKIAQVVGISEASVYHFFKNKNDLVETSQIEAYRRSYLEMVIPFSAAVDLSDSAEDFIRVVRKLYEMIFSVERHPIRAARIQVIGAAMASPRLRESLNLINREVHEELAEVIRRAQSRGWVNPDRDARAIAYWINAQTNGRVLIEMDPDWGDLSKWNEIAVAAVLSIFDPNPK